ncbi:MAG TPA: chorismate synthase [Chloroflexota bacterium]|nr:chorismate synthase [Chloroflexota bacterium]
MLRFLTAGESHGPELLGILEGMPAGLELDVERINDDLRRRQGGYGRSGRQRIEHDEVVFLGGVERERTTGAPIAIRVENRDYPNQLKREKPVLTVPRPGHADLAGAQKYRLDDMRTVLERASARETAMRVAIGAIAKQLLWRFGIGVWSQVLAIGEVTAEPADLSDPEARRHVEESPVRVADAAAGERMVAAIDEARRARDTLGGIVEVTVAGAPVGLGSYVQWDRKLDGRLAQAVMSIQAIKGVEIGSAFANALAPGTRVHDAIVPSDFGPVRTSNRAGGLEGGVTTGGQVVVRAAMKPISTTLTPMQSVDVRTGNPARATYQRSDICAVPAASVVAEAMVALVMADAFLEKVGGDSISEIAERYGAPR